MKPCPRCGYVEMPKLEKPQQNNIYPHEKLFGLISNPFVIMSIGVVIFISSWVLPEMFYPYPQWGYCTYRDYAETPRFILTTALRLSSGIITVIGSIKGIFYDYA